MYFVRVEFENKKEMVPFPFEEEITFESFLKNGKYEKIIFSYLLATTMFFDSNYASLSIVLKTFNVKLNNGFGEMLISDQYDTPIRELPLLKYAIEVFSKSGCFYLKVSFNQSEPDLITSQVIET